MIGRRIRLMSRVVAIVPVKVGHVATDKELLRTLPRGRVWPRVSQCPGGLTEERVQDSLLRRRIEKLFEPSPGVVRVSDKLPLPGDNHRIGPVSDGKTRDQVGKTTGIDEPDELLPIRRRCDDPVARRILGHVERLRQWERLKAVLPDVLEVPFPLGELSPYRFHLRKTPILRQQVGMDNRAAGGIDDVDVPAVDDGQREKMLPDLLEPRLFRPGCASSLVELRDDRNRRLSLGTKVRDDRLAQIGLDRSLENFGPRFRRSHRVAPRLDAEHRNRNHHRDDKRHRCGQHQVEKGPPDRPGSGVSCSRLPTGAKEKTRRTFILFHGSLIFYPLGDGVNGAPAPDRGPVSRRQLQRSTPLGRFSRHSRSLRRMAASKPLRICRNRSSDRASPGRWYYTLN
jgi:hypothetical protein